eukprot:GHVQ01024201.1.p1 GENE.GHVQ01024201.1~~GHVQ01024201.1.p1  ORF type:complete len:391 (+),score=58.52 GHVQ01024201.1:179-1351(+)
MVDTMAELYPNALNRFTCWQQYTNKRYTNEGCRIDYILMDRCLFTSLNPKIPSTLLPHNQTVSHCHPHSELPPPFGLPCRECGNVYRCRNLVDGCTEHNTNSVLAVSLATCGGRWRPAPMDGSGLQEEAQTVYDTQFCDVMRRRGGVGEEGIVTADEQQRYEDESMQRGEAECGDGGCGEVMREERNPSDVICMSYTNHHMLNINLIYTPPKYSDHIGVALDFITFSQIPPVHTQDGNSINPALPFSDCVWSSSSADTATRQAQPHKHTKTLFSFWRKDNIKPREGDEGAAPDSRGGQPKESAEGNEAVDKRQTIPTQIVSAQSPIVSIESTRTPLASQLPYPPTSNTYSSSSSTYHSITAPSRKKTILSSQTNRGKGGQTSLKSFFLKQ